MVRLLALGKRRGEGWNWRYITDNVADRLAELDLVLEAASRHLLSFLLFLCHLLCLLSCLIGSVTLPVSHCQLHHPYVFTQLPVCRSC
jgi:hypothetical protein